MSRRCVWSCSVLAVYAWVTPALASSGDLGFGSRSIAMGGAVTGRVSDASANHYNPSGLVLSETTQLSFELARLDREIELGGEPLELPSLDTWALGLVTSGRLLGVPLAFGAALRASGDQISRTVTYQSEERRWFLHQERPEQLQLSANLALRPLDWLALGAGYAFSASTRGKLLVSGTFVQPSAETDEFDSALEHAVIADLVSERIPLLGLTLLLRPDLDLGLGYRGEGRTRLDVGAEIDGALAFGPISVPTRYVLASETVAYFIPRQLTLGLRWGALAELDVHADLAWVNWSAMPDPQGATWSELSTSPPPDVLLNLPEPPAPTEPRAAGLEDRLLPRLGLEWRSRDETSPSWAVRAGYAYEATPLGSRSAPTLVDRDLHLVSVGGGIGFARFGKNPRGAVLVDAHVQLGSFGSGTNDSKDGGHFVAFGCALGLHL